MILRLLLQKIHWQAPAVILSTFIAGLAFSIGHHVFYSHLDGQSVDGRLFDQQINLAIGQAFAFLVRASLVISIGTSYWQVFWRTVLDGPLAVNQLDTLAGMLGSVLDLLNFKSSISRPVLVVLALLSWMVPLASILPPATLAVHGAAEVEYTYAHVPIPQFIGRSMANVSPQADVTGEREARYISATRQLSKVVKATAFQGAVVDHRTLYPNSTYTLDFIAPAVKCDAISQDLLLPASGHVGCILMKNGNYTSGLNCDGWITHLSWVPSADNPVPFGNNDLTGGKLQPSSNKYYRGEYDHKYIGGVADGPASVYLATRSLRLPYDMQNWDIISCSMYNASYVVNVTSDSNNRGVLSKPIIHALNDVPFNVSAYMYNIGEVPLANQTASFSYFALMESLNKLLVGAIWGGKWARMGSTGYFDESLLTAQNEGFTQTLLPFTRELLPFSGSQQLTGLTEAQQPDPKQWTFWEDIGNMLEVWFPSEAYASPTFNQSLGTAVEELFHNMTLSLFSNPAFLEDATDAVEIAYTITHNIYSYNSKSLLISYGLAVGFALVASLTGCASIYCNGASYSNRFSTVLRTTRGQELEELIASNDRSGIDPLPEYLAKTRIDLRRSQFDSEHSVDAGRVELIGEQTAMMSVPQSDSQSAASHWWQNNPIGLRSVSTNTGVDHGRSVETRHQGKAGTTALSHEVDSQR